MSMFCSLLVTILSSFLYKILLISPMFLSSTIPFRAISPSPFITKSIKSYFRNFSGNNLTAAPPITIRGLMSCFSFFAKANVYGICSVVSMENPIRSGFSFSISFVKGFRAAEMSCLSSIKLFSNGLLVLNIFSNR